MNPVRPSSPSDVPPGTVYLVGAGPGDAGLITVRGVECLRRADLVLYDGLVNPLLMKYTRAETVRTSRASPGRDSLLPQDDINARLIAAAKSGLNVVRLKGGDPCIFGRGSEEARALQAAGIPFEIVPGVTAAAGAAIYSGLSLTHREHSSAVAFITGHEDPTKPSSHLDYDVLAAFRGTLVFYMGLHRLPEIAASLIAGGKPEETPACIVSRATTPLQKRCFGTLATLPGKAKEAGLHAPSLIIVGTAAAGADYSPTWFDSRPLLGLTIGLCRPRAQGEELGIACERLGARAAVMPAIAVEPMTNTAAMQEVLSRLTDYDWIVFTSPNAVDAFLGEAWRQGRDGRSWANAMFACIGPATEAALERYRLRADIVPESYRGEALAERMAPLVDGQRVLWPRASRGRDVIPEILQRAGAEVETLVVYQNVDVDSWPAPAKTALVKGEIDWLALSSPSIARSVARLLEQVRLEHPSLKVPKIAAISPVTAEEARRCGLDIAAEATIYTWPGLFEAIAKAEGRVWLADIDARLPLTAGDEGF